MFGKTRRLKQLEAQHDAVIQKLEQLQAEVNSNDDPITPAQRQALEQHAREAAHTSSAVMSHLARFAGFMQAFTYYAGLNGLILLLTTFYNVSAQLVMSAIALGTLLIVIAGRYIVK